MEAQLHELQEEITRSSDLVLTEEDKRLQGTLREIDQSIRKLIETSDYLKLSGDADSLIDIKQLEVKSRELDSLMDLLRKLYWREESLDLFLKYTINSDAEEVPVFSDTDPKYQSLQDEVSHLRDDVMPVKNQEIDQITGEILQVAHEITEKQDQVNMLYLETTNELDKCWELLDEWQRLQDDQRITKNEDNSNRKDTELNAMEECYEEWKTLEELAVLNDNLQKQIDELEKVDNKAINSTQLAEESIVNTVQLNDLIDMWKRRIIASIHEDISEIVLYPYSRKLQLRVANRYTIIIQLDKHQTHDGKSTIHDIDLFTEQDSRIIPMRELRKQVLQECKGHSNILQALKNIINRVINNDN